MGAFLREALAAGLYFLAAVVVWGIALCVALAVFKVAQLIVAATPTPSQQDKLPRGKALLRWHWQDDERPPDPPSRGAA